MPTTKQRINITLSDEIKQALTRLARRDRMPEAAKATRLLEIALEIEEDVVWNEIAAKRDIKGVHFVPHSKAWK